jgi:putative oxidoreductase
MMAIFRNAGKYKDFGILIIRVGLGVMFIYHGFPKLFGGPVRWEKLGAAAGSIGIHFFPMLWGFLSAATETAGGFLLILGLVFRPVCLLLLLNLVVAAAFTYSLDHSFGDATHAIEDAIVFAGLFFIGAGKYSMDKH